MKQIYNILDLIGRIFFAYFFIPSGIGKITGYSATLALMSGHGLPGWLLPLAIILEIVGGLAVLTGWYTRIAAFLLGGYAFIAVAVFWLHPFGPSNIVQTAEATVAAALWLLAAHGAGGWSLDAYFTSRRGQRGGVRPGTTPAQA